MMKMNKKEKIGFFGYTFLYVCLLLYLHMLDLSPFDVVLIPIGFSLVGLAFHQNYISGPYFRKIEELFNEIEDQR